MVEAARSSSRREGTSASTALVSLDLPEGALELEVPVPHRPERLVDFAGKMLPLCDAVAEMAAREAMRLGQPVTCAKGCGACCRQLVPLSPPEAGIIFEHVCSLPEAHREAITNRFQRALERLGRAGLRSELEAVASGPFDEQVSESLASRYFSLQIPCPFLEEEACSIYPVRPSMCREYQVVSEARHCFEPYGGEVVRLPLSFRLSEALMRLSAKADQKEAQVIPLLLALQWAGENAHMRHLAASGRDWLRHFLHSLSSLVASRNGASAPGHGLSLQPHVPARTGS
jgi:Fe-S-cluster containining protein